MANENMFDTMISSYESAFNQHGDSPAALLGAKGRQHLRFQALAPLIVDSGAELSVLDYGCGLGHLLPFLVDRGWHGTYCGLDLVPSFIEYNRKMYADTVEFKLIRPDEPIDGSWDIVFASGVFNLLTHNSIQESKVYAFKRMAELFGLCRHYFVCDFMTEYVDYRQEGAQHFSPQEIIDFTVKNLTRRFVLRHDLMPFEFTMIGYHNVAIERPVNIFRTAASV